MTDEEINYRTLRKIEQMEKNSPVLTKIKSDFYTSLSDYLKELNNRLENEDNPQKKIIIKDEIENIKKLSLSIYELREKKVLLAVVSKARGGNPDTTSMINSEKDLFDSILEIMLKHRDSTFENKKTEKNEIVQESKPEQPIQEENESVKIGQRNPILKVNKDVPEFIGTDEKKYFLKKNDLISLPPDMSEMLVKRGVAETIDQLA